MAAELKALSMRNPLQNEGQPSYSTLRPSSSGTDWKSKYMEAADILAETRAELDEFQAASKDLEEELERELQRTEEEKERLRKKASKAESESDDWKTKFINLQTLHNTAINSLQKELDTLRQEYHRLKVQMRELEMGNDSLERNERAVASSLADLEVKYAKALEEKILLEHELLDKANLEEGMQRLKDELRDTSEEIEILKEQLQLVKQHPSKIQSVAPPVPPKTKPVPVTKRSQSTSSLDFAPSLVSSNDLLLSDLDVPCNNDESTSNKADIQTSVSKSASSSYEPQPNPPVGRSSLDASIAIRQSSVNRSNTLPSLSHTTLPKRNPLPNLLAMERPPFPGKGSTSSVSTSSVTKSKGVQMVSEMRARVRNLELKIHSRVPRLRLGSTPRSGAASPKRLVGSTRGDLPDRQSTFPQDPSGRNRSGEGRTSVASAEIRDRQGAESPGWVLIMEESPTRLSSTDKAIKRRKKLSNPNLAPSAFRKSSEDNPLEPSPSNKNVGTHTSTSRPSSRLSASTAGGLFKTNGAFSVTAGTARPVTPTFLPVPSRDINSIVHPSHKRHSFERARSPQLSNSMASKRNTTGQTCAPGVGLVVPSSRRQSAEGIQPRHHNVGGRSSLPGAIPFAFEQRQTSEAADNSSQTQQRNTLLSSQQKTNSISSIDLLNKSRIGRPTKRSSAGLTPRLPSDS